MAQQRMTTVLVDKVENIQKAVEDLKKYKTLGVDCEGVDLGKDGELCLLQVATPEKVYLFDIEILKEEVFTKDMRDMLEDDSITKLFFDCREDCNALKHLYNVNVKGIEDMQLLNTINMKLNGRRWQCVTGLQKCMSVHLPSCGFSAVVKDRMSKAMTNDKTIWKKRPLPQEYISYASHDVFYLSRLRSSIAGRISRFQASPEIVTDLLRYSSTRYADFMRDNTGYQRDSKYYRTARLPERIIPELEKTGSVLNATWKLEKFTETTGRLCNTCHWRTNTKPSGQCQRCYLIDNPDQFNRQYAPRKRSAPSSWDFDY